MTSGHNFHIIHDFGDEKLDSTAPAYSLKLLEK